MYKTGRLIRWVLAGVLLAATPVHAADRVYTGWLSDVAADGYDVVAFFARGEALEGSAEHSHEWRGAQWRFTSEANLERFRANPQRYAPAYGGHCALAVAEGSAEAGDPRYWTIHEGRLFFNYNGDVQERWNEDRAGYIAAADEQWPEMVE